MTLEERVNEELKTAMKSRDKAAMRSLRAIKSAILLFKTSGTGETLDEDNEIKLLQKLVKQRKDSLEIYTKQGREDLAKTEKEEIDIIESYLPEQLSDADIAAIVKQIISDTGASGMRDMGKVMQETMKKLAGKADGKTISRIVKSLLS